MYPVYPAVSIPLDDLSDLALHHLACLLPEHRVELLQTAWREGDPRLLVRREEFGVSAARPTSPSSTPLHSPVRHLLVGLDAVFSVFSVVRMVSCWPFVVIVLFVTNAIWTLSVLHDHLYVDFLSDKMYQCVLPAVPELWDLVANALCTLHSHSAIPAAQLLRLSLLLYSILFDRISFVNE